jgi:hypothetical protein
MDVTQDGSDGLEHFLTQIRAAPGVGREEFHQHLLGRDKIHRSQNCDHLHVGAYHGSPGVMLAT